MIGYGFDGVGWVLVHNENARGTVTFSEDMYSNRAVLDGTVTPRPPRQVGRAKSSHSVSLTLSRPVSAGMKRVLMSSSNGTRKSEMSDMEHRKYIMFICCRDHR